LVSLQPELVEFLTIQWTHNGHSIIVDEHITQTKNSSTSAVLTFTSVQVRHLGTYTCSGISSIGDITIIGSNVYTLTITGIVI
jgi:tagatose-1,6-bisphosphate aldolase non-catalytic subunit AgaZ/GatZ